MPTYQTPGVYREDVFLEPLAGLRTGVPAFLGYTRDTALVPTNVPQTLTLWAQWESYFGPPPEDTFLGYAVRGFFENGGRLCYVVRLDSTNPDRRAALCGGLAALASLDAIDLVCAPDIMRPRGVAVAPDPNEARTMQAMVIKHCDAHGARFAILDSFPGASPATVIQQRQGLATAVRDPAVPYCPSSLDRAVQQPGTNGALYYPWLKVPADPTLPERLVPPCGHVAGAYARSDQRIGVHKAPANELLAGVVDLEIDVSDAEQDRLNQAGINCLRAFPGRGIRVWGARTLSSEAAWRYVNVRRLFLTVGRWIEQNMTGAVFEPNDLKLWARMGRDLTVYFNELFRQGALRGSTPQEAFYVKCDAETNPEEVRNAGRVVTEIGLAPGIPNEFVVVRIMQGAGGVTITGPTAVG